MPSSALAMAREVSTRNGEYFLPIIVVLFKNVVDSLAGTEEVLAAFADVSPPQSHILRVHDALVDMNIVIAAILHDFHLVHARTILDKELGFSVLPRSTVWYSNFLLHEYDDDRWVANFRFTKAAIFRMAAVLAPHCQRQDTKYRRVVPMRVHIACVLYKLV